MKKSILTAILAVASISFASAQSALTAKECADKKNVSLVLNNENHMTGFQFDAVYPEGWTVKVVKGENLKVTDEDGENLFALKWKNNTCLVYSDTAAEIESGEVAVVQVTATTDGTIKLTNIKGAGSGVYAVTTKMDDVEIPFAGGEFTGISGITVDGQNAAAYNLAGQKVNDNFKGVVIVNGKKVVK